MKIDFIRLCQEKHIPYLESGHHHCHEGWIQTHCPFCADRNYGWHLGYSLEFGNMNCWRCGGHSVYAWLKAILPHENTHRIIEEYKVQGAFALNIRTPKMRKRDAVRPPHLGTLSSAHRRYLRARNFDPGELIEKWDLMGAGHLSGPWRWRIVAPVRSMSGRIVAYTGRAIHPDVRPRWKTTEKDKLADDPRKIIYGIDRVEGDSVLIVEGPSDVWRMGYGSVALLGIDWKPEQAFVLRSFAKRFIMFDPQKEAQKRARELANWLSPFPGETEIITGIGSDPGDLSDAESYKIMQELGIQ